MIFTATPSLAGCGVEACRGASARQVAMGADVFRDFVASVTDSIDGGSAASAPQVPRPRFQAPNAIVGTDRHHAVVRQEMQMVSAAAAAVTVTGI